MGFTARAWRGRHRYHNFHSDDLLRRLIEETLSDAGLEATIVASGVAQLTRHSEKYRAHVTDINLSGEIDGWEVAHWAPEMHPERGRK
jgi:CheY-like chemotaxis protein